MKFGEHSADECESSRLWKRVAEDAGLNHILRSLRSRANTIAGNSVATQPAMTDHTGRHFDALWRVADEVLVAEEVAKLTPTEAFLLGASFYVHDLGMSFGFSDAEKDQLRSTPSYTAARSRLGSIANADEIALQIAVRRTHADRSVALCTESLALGRNEYLIEAKTDREMFGWWIAKVSESHNWSLQRLKVELGDKGSIAIGTSGARADIGLVGALLRIIDFAHINKDRSSTLERALRPSMPTSSLEHWLGQENVSGPIRDGDYLKYTSSIPIESVDGWWLFYGMLRGLDEEIRSTRQFLESRPRTVGWLSLHGVHGAHSPADASRWIQPHGFEPIDVKVRADSIEKLVDLLGGKTLYGDSPLPAVRELIQNAMDAVHLRRAMEARSDIGDVSVELKQAGDATTLLVRDTGIGMRAEVMRDYLLAVASNYWKSERFASDVGSAVADQFRPAGRFGVGFLSVFMLGDDITVKSQRIGADAVTLHLRGVDRIGELRVTTPALTSGTSVEVKLKPAVAAVLADSLGAIARLLPMTDIQLSVGLPLTQVQVAADRWRSEGVGDFLNRVHRTLIALALIAGPYDPRYGSYSRDGARRASSSGDGGSEDFGAQEYWGGSLPELVGGDSRVVAVRGIGRVIICSRGIAVCSLPVSGFAGMLNEDDVVLDVSRTRVVGYDVEARRAAWAAAICPKIRTALEERAKEYSLASLQQQIGTCIAVYGHDLLDSSSLAWIWTVTPSGQMSPITSAEFAALCRTTRKFVVLYGMGPLSALKLVDVVRELRGLPLLVQPEPGHRAKFAVDEDDDTDEEQVFKGTLQELLPEYAFDGLLVGVLSVAARSIAKSVPELATTSRWVLRRTGSKYSRTNTFYGTCEV